jgi:hypothetical protein
LDVIPIESPSLFSSLFRSHHDRRLLHRDGTPPVSRPTRSPLPRLSVSCPAEPLNASIAGKANAQEPPVRAFVGGFLHLKEEDKMAVLRLDP